MQRILLGLIDQSWFVKTIHLCCNSCPGQVATWISWPWFVRVMKWLWTAWPLHCSVAMPLPPLLCGSCWQEDLGPKFTPQCPSRASVSSFGSAPDVTTYCLLTVRGTNWQPFTVEELVREFLGAGGKLHPLSGCCAFLLYWRARGHYFFQGQAPSVLVNLISLWALSEWDVLERRFCFENILWWKSNEYANHFNF